MTHPSTTVKTVGVIGGGQLAWMMVPAAHQLGVNLIVQTPQITDPAASVATETVLAPIADATATALLAQNCDVITFENEFVDLEALAILEAQGVCFRPRLSVLVPLLDKYQQLSYLRQIGLPTPEFRLWDDPTPLETWWQESSPGQIVVKVRRHGYDGQGTFIVSDATTLREIQQKLGSDNLLLQQFIPFERELAVIAARSVTGEVAIYPIVETMQVNQVCQQVIAPADINPELEKTIASLARTLLNSLGAVGIFGIELFLTRDQQVFINEIAPRTHNSGHFTIDACKTSQFEQHLRAVCGFPLGATDLMGAGAVMVNLLGYEYSHDDYQRQREIISNIPHTTIHWYQKSECRPGRKMGHVTVLLESNSPLENREMAIKITQQVLSIWQSK